MVDHLTMAQPHAAPRLRQQIGRVCHTLHPARNHHIGTARDQQIMGQHRRLHAGPTHFIDSGTARRLGHTRPQTGLTRRGLTQTGGQHIAEDHFAHILARHTGARQCLTDRDRAKLRGGRLLQVALKAAHRRARGTDNNDWVLLGHRCVPLVTPSR